MLALVLGLAWLIQAIDGIRLPQASATGPKSRTRKALWIVLAALTVSHIVAAAFSVDPAQTVAGFFAARAGTLSVLSGVVLCAALAVHLRTVQQVERLVTAIILPGIPLALYGIAQAIDFDPIPHLKADSRVFSLAGHPTVWNSLLKLSDSEKPSHLPALVLIPSLVVMALFGGAEALARRRSAIAAVGRIVACGSVAFAISALLKAPTISGLSLSASAAGTPADALALVPNVAWMLTVFAALCGAIVVLLTLACTPPVGERTPFAKWQGATAAVLGVAAALFCIRPIAWDYVLADAIADRAFSLRKGSKDESVIVLLEKAASLDTVNFFHRIDAAESCVTLARMQKSPADFSAWMRRAEAALLAAHTRSPLNPAAAPLGRLHFDWAMLPGDAQAREAHAATARRFYDEALRHDPTAIHVWMESGWLDEVLMREPERAEQKFAKADALSEMNFPDQWGAYFAARSFEPIHPTLKRLAARRGIVHFEKELRWAEQFGKAPFALRMGKGTLHRNLRELNLALDEFRVAREVGPAEERWKADIMLAYTHADLGDKVSAQLAVIRALKSAPAFERGNLEKLRAELSR